jgi:HEAT repeat protein
MTLGGFLKHNEWPLVFNVINILGKIGKNECVPYLAHVREHGSAKVRNESLYGLSLCNSQKAKALLPTFLDDREMRIRINASRILAEKLNGEALPYLGAIIRSRDFNKRDLKERKAFLENLGRIREPDSAEILREVLYRRVFLRRRQWREIKVCVESVLASTDLEEADAVLAGWKKDQVKWFFRLLY